MKRENVRLYREHHWTSDGRMLRGTILPKAPVPLKNRTVIAMQSMEREPLGEHDMTRIVGMVTDVRRGSWGWVLGTLHARWLGEDFDLTGLACQAEFDAVTWDHDKRDRVIGYDARLRAVVLGTSPCWKRMWIK